MDKGELLSNWHKGALQASGDAEEVRKKMTLAHLLRGGGERGVAGEDWRQILPYAPGPAQVSLNPRSGNTGLSACALGAAGDQGCQAHRAPLAQWVLRGIRRAKGRTREGGTRWAPDSPAAVGLGAGGDGPDVDGRPLDATSQASWG